MDKVIPPEPKRLPEFQTNMLRWGLYTAFLFALLFWFKLSWTDHIGAALILGHFSAQLNALIYKN